MRKLCGLIVVALCASTASAVELSTTPLVKVVSNTSSVMVGDQALNLKLAVRIGDLKSNVKQAKADEGGDENVEQTSARIKTSADSQPKPKVLKPLKRRILVFKATWCGACQALNYEWPSMKQVGWRVGEKPTDHIQLVDSDLRPDLVSRYGITALPTLVLVDGDEELGRQGLLGARSIAEFYYERIK